VSADWAAHADFAALSHPDLDCAGAGEGGKVAILKVVTADVTGDGVPDAIVRAQCAHSASEWPDSVYVYSDASGTPALIGTLLRQSDQSYANTISAGGDTVTLGLVTWSSFAAGCCPDLHYSQRFTWTGSTFHAGARTDALHACDAQPGSLPLTIVDDGGATGHAAITLIWRNRLPQPCTLTGFPGVDGVSSGGSTVHAARPSIPYRTVTLPVNGYASAILEWATIAGSGSCTALSARILVTPPNTTATQTLSRQVGLCSLQIHPVVAGRNGI
jgi:hypothetical protein